MVCGLLPPPPLLIMGSMRPQDRSLMALAPGPREASGRGGGDILQPRGETSRCSHAMQRDDRDAHGLFADAVALALISSPNKP